MTDHQDFIQANGGNPIPVGDRWLLPSGAYAGDADLIGPPTDPAERLQSRRMYWSARLDRAEDDIQRLRSAVQGGDIFTWNKTVWGPGPKASDAGDLDLDAALKTLSRFQREARDRLSIIDEELDSLAAPDFSQEIQDILNETPETFMDFAKRHGDYVIIGQDQHLFHDGAESNGTEHLEPEENSEERVLEVKLLYSREKLRQEEERFRDVEQYVADQSEIRQKIKDSPPVDRQAFKDLKRLRASVVRLQERVRRSKRLLDLFTGPSSQERAVNRLLAQERAEEQEQIRRAMGAGV